jgi:rhamnosyl/mannosyltransferase
MRVLHITKYYPPVKGGIESVAHTIVSGLNRRGVITDVLCSNNCPETVINHGEHNERITRVASLGKIMSTSIAPRMVFELWRKRYAYDLIHVQMPDPICCIALFLARPRVPIIVHWQSDVVKQKFALLLYSWLQTWLLKRANAIIATSRAYAESSLPLSKCLDKLSIIPIGIDEPKKLPSMCPEWIKSFIGGRKLVFCLGRMTYYKGFETIIDAAKNINSDCAIVVGGGGELLKKNRARVKSEGLEGKISFLGEIDQTTAQYLFENCDLFCLPSIVRSEAFGVVIVEAMAASKPVIATDISGSGVPWVNSHGETGLNVPVNNPIALAGGINQLLNDRQMREAMGFAARQRYERIFTSKTMLDSIWSLYCQQFKEADSNNIPQVK